MAHTKPGLGARELAVMKVVWRLEEASVREVYEAKGYLKKRADGRAFRYRPARPQGRVITSLVREFVDRVFDGASRPLLAHLVMEGRLTKEEREELKRLIDEAE
jgi:BlaI family penicillinase repressor